MMAATWATERIDRLKKPWASSASPARIATERDRRTIDLGDDCSISPRPTFSTQRPPGIQGSAAPCCKTSVGFLGRELLRSNPISEYE